MIRKVKVYHFYTSNEVYASAFALDAHIEFTHTDAPFEYVVEVIDDNVSQQAEVDRLINIAKVSGMHYDTITPEKPLNF